MKISERGLALVKEFEGCSLRAYRDIVGIWTVGFGHTGPDVTPNLAINDSEADRLLREDIQHAERCVNRLLSGLQATQGEFDSLCSFVFNLGCDALRRSTLLAKYLDGDVDGAAAEFDRWNRAGGRVVKGLVRRRAAEAELFRS